MIAVSMHPYVAAQNGRDTVRIVIVVLAVLSAFALDAAQEALESRLPWWLDTPAVFGFWGLYFKLWDVVLWRLKWFQKLPNATPFVAGKWRAEILSSHDGHVQTIPGEITIRQTWSNISIYFEGERSKSSSVAASMAEDAMGWSLLYHYDNVPGAEAPASMERHDGTAWLRFAQDLKNADGTYFTGRGRLTQGTLNLTRISSRA